MQHVKSMLNGEKLNVNPARTDAKDNTETALAGATVGASSKCFPPRPRAMIMVIHTGMRIIRPIQLINL